MKMETAILKNFDKKKKTMIENIYWLGFLFSPAFLEYFYYPRLIEERRWFDFAIIAAFHTNKNVFFML